MLIDQVVIVIDCSNYKSEAQEKVPFKASVLEVTNNEIWVKSIETENVFELYFDQVLESYSNENLAILINTKKYGDTC